MRETPEFRARYLHDEDLSGGTTREYQSEQSSLNAVLLHAEKKEFRKKSHVST
jgi:hypothetical protein